MPTYHYGTVDVFTEQPLSGNPVAVVLDADGLSTEQMQALAAEFNYVETTFVLPQLIRATQPRCASSHPTGRCRSRAIPI